MAERSRVREPHSVDDEQSDTVREPHSTQCVTRTPQSAGNALEPYPAEPDPDEPSRAHRDATHDADDRIDVSAIESRDASSVVVLDLDAVFESIWAEWPKKTSRKPARMKFEIAARRHPRGFDGLVDDAIAHGRAYGAHTSEQFVPMLANWLSDERWNDSLPTRRSGSSQVDHNAAVMARYAGADAS